MVQAIATRICSPPALPDHLKRVYNLKPIVGTPNDDEVQGIHAVLRMAHTVAHIPDIFDPELAMSLSQHLFEVQMARYREKHPSGMFPEDMVHTPPTLPSHIPVTLEPIRGVPSDEELQGAQGAIRAYEQMAIVPSMFDPKVGMELSQHLFNIQFARYMHDAPRAELGKKITTTKASHQPAHTRQPLDTASKLSDEGLPDLPNEPIASSGPPIADQFTSSTQVESSTDPTPPRATVAESNDQLTKIVDVLESIKQGTTSYSNGNTRYTTMRYETMNDKGELPTAQGLPLPRRNFVGKWDILQLSDENLAQYLQFYNLGDDLIRLGDTPTIQDGKRDDAVILLSNYLNNRIRPS